MLFTASKTIILTFFKDFLLSCNSPGKNIWKSKKRKFNIMRTFEVFIDRVTDDRTNFFQI